jgi:hypothetical protein
MHDNLAWKVWKFVLAHIMALITNVAAVYTSLTSCCSVFENKELVDYHNVPRRTGAFALHEYLFKVRV